MVWAMNLREAFDHLIRHWSELPMNVREKNIEAFTKHKHRFLRSKSISDDKLRETLTNCGYGQAESWRAPVSDKSE